MKTYHSFKEIDQELERLNKEAEQELNHIKTHYGDIKTNLGSISTLSGIMMSFIRKQAVSKVTSQLKKKLIKKVKKG